MKRKRDTEPERLDFIQWMSGRGPRPLPGMTKPLPKCDYLFASINGHHMEDLSFLLKPENHYPVMFPWKDLTGNGSPVQVGLKHSTLMFRVPEDAVSNEDVKQHDKFVDLFLWKNMARPTRVVKLDVDHRILLYTDHKIRDVTIDHQGRETYGGELEGPVKMNNNCDDALAQAMTREYTRVLTELSVRNFIHSNGASDHISCPVALAVTWKPQQAVMVSSILDQDLGRFLRIHKTGVLPNQLFKYQEVYRGRTRTQPWPTLNGSLPSDEHFHMTPHSQEDLKDVASKVKSVCAYLRAVFILPFLAGFMPYRHNQSPLLQVSQRSTIFDRQVLRIVLRLSSHHFKGALPPWTPVADAEVSS